MDAVFKPRNLLFLHLSLKRIQFDMKEVKTTVSKKRPKSWLLTKQSLSQDEFFSGIKEAEEGPFHTVQESKENFELWLKSREKK